MNTLTKREQIAAMAMQGFIAAGFHRDTGTTEIAEHAIQHADKLIAVMKIDDMDPDFWKRMFIRERCGCLKDYCGQHGEYNPDDVDRLREEGVLK
jgi:hypothetical protein